MREQTIAQLKANEQWQTPQLSGECYFYHCNHLGLPEVLTNQNGEAVWAASYDAWGNVKEEHNPNSLHQPIRLPGQYHDKETNLYYNRHRYYDPELGNYINQDPIGLASGEPNLTVYPRNPVQGMEPLGLDWISDVQGMGAWINWMPAPAPPWYQNAAAYEILKGTYSELKNQNLAGVDNFFHCLAFCRVSKSPSASNLVARTAGVIKEMSDFPTGVIGVYGKKEKIEPVAMLKDNLKDFSANEHGLSCPSDENCGARCEVQLDGYLLNKEELKKRGFL